MQIDEIRKMAIEKKQLLEKAGADLTKIINILNFLSDDMCFFKTDINITIPILLYLGVSEEKVKDVYFQLIDAKNYKKECDVRTIIVK